MKKKNKIFSGKLIFLVLLIVFAWIAVNYFGQTKHIIQVLTSGKWYWIALAAIFQICYYPFYSFFVERVFGIFNIEFDRKCILPVYLASKFTDVALPIATVGRVAIFVRNGKRHNVSPVDVGIGISFEILLEISAFLSVALFTMFLLYVFAEPRAYLLITLLILLVAVLVTTISLIRLSTTKKPLNRYFLWIVKTIAKAAGQPNATVGEIEKIIQEVGIDLRKGQDKIWPVYWMAVFTHIINIATLAFVYLAFANSYSFLAILAGYTASMLFTIVSITPQGVGVAETIMISTLHSFGLDIPVSAVITLAFRGLLYWLPMFPGFYFFSHLELRSEES